MTKYISYLFAGLLVSSTAVMALTVDIKDAGIGFVQSPDSISTPCLLQQTFPGFTTTLYYNSVAEPTVDVNPICKNRVVAAWLQDRITSGGALEAGIGYSCNGGRTWFRTTVPFQRCSGGVAQRISDLWLSYAADGSRIYLVGLLTNAETDPTTTNQNGVLVSFSTDNGKTWSNPAVVAASSDSLQSGGHIFEKTSITTDRLLNNNAYVVWDQYVNSISLHADTWFSRTLNGGLTWEAPRIIYNPFLDPTLLSNGIQNNNQTTNNVIVGLPNGDLLNFMTRIYAKPGASNIQYIDDVWPYQYTTFDIAFVRSSDKGLTWSPIATQVAVVNQNDDYSCGYNIVGGVVLNGEGQLLRTAGLSADFSVAVHPTTGTIYVVWEDSRFTTPGNHLSQIALSLSRDNGVTWTAPIRVNRTPVNAANPIAFTPSVAVTANGQVGILYHDFRNSPLPCASQTTTDAWFALYQDTGVSLNFTGEVRLSSQSYIMENGPDTEGITTNGDYNSVVARGSKFYSLYVKSFNGPFNPAQTVINSPAEGTLILDNNRRTWPFFSRIDTQ